MHIVYLTIEFVTEKISGGLGTYLDNLARIMSSHGHKVTIITLSHEDSEFDYHNGIHVIRVKVSEQENTIRRFITNSWRLNRRLHKLGAQCDIDIVQVANLQTIGLFGCCGFPNVLRISSDSAVCRYGNQYSFDLEKAVYEKTLYDRLELSVARRANYVFAPSKFCAEIVARRAHCRVDVIESPYLERTEDFDDSVYRNHLVGKKYLLFNSALSSLKGTHIGIEAMDDLMRRYSDLYMVYAGIDVGITCKDGSVQKVRDILERMKRKYEERVIYLGVLRREQLFPVIENAYACVLLSRVENLSNSCIEAMALKKIVIATYGASFEQLIKNKKSGLLVKRESPRALINAVDYLMSMSDDDKRTMESNARKAIERLNPEIIYEKMINIYKNIIKSRKRD